MSEEKPEALEEKKPEEPVDEVDPAQRMLADWDHLESVVRHIRNVQEAALLLGKKLIRRGEEAFGRQLIANSMIHDQSKFSGIEWEYLRNGPSREDHDLATAHKQHVHTNPHHIEYWGSQSDMPRIYVAEMVCDLYARSAEMGTDLREYVKNVHVDRHSIPKSGKLWKWMKEFMDLLLDKPFS